MPRLFHDGAGFPRLTLDCDPPIACARLTASNEMTEARHMRLAFSSLHDKGGSKNCGEDSEAV